MNTFRGDEMSEKRFELDVRVDMPKLLIDTATNKRYHLLLINDIEELVGLLNEQQATINELKERNAHNFAKKMQLMKEIKELKAKLREKEEDEKLYANEIVELRKTNEEWLQFKELGGDY